MAMPTKKANRFALVSSTDESYCIDFALVCSSREYGAIQERLDLEPAMSEQEYLEHIHELASKNKVFKSYIGLGYHPSNLPAVIQRNILENPGWYTAYTPYQAEIAQGR